jgi:subtilisin family serine protease
MSWTRPRLRRLSLSLATGSLVAAALTTGIGAAPSPADAAAGAGPRRPATPTSPESTHRITLVTGDVVTLRTFADGRQVADVDRPADAVGGVRMQEVGGDLYVVPDEAAPLLGAGKLDRRLFDVTELVAMGYDDKASSGVPVIATYPHRRTRTATAPSAPGGSKLVRRLPAIDGVALSTAKRRARTFWSALAPKVDPTDPTPELGAGVDKLWLDGRVTVDLKDSVPQIGAPEAWAAGYDGAGTTVAMLDTGVDSDHPDLVGQITATESFVPGEDATTDINGHGTHVASTIVGTGAASGGEYKGVAPGAHLIVGKVLGGAEGYGQDSWVMAGMEWAAESGADVVSMSLGDTTLSDGSDPMAQEVDALSAQYGTLFVIAAGNAGPESISTPGSAASALTVGAVDKQDALASFSSTGPLTKTGALKPDITAPGVDITAARSQDMTDGGDGLYRTLSGTSMATPHVAGAAAILAERHPGWTGAQLKEQLMSTAKGLDPSYSPYEVGTGRVDVAAAVRTDVRATGSLFFGNYLWPQEPTDTAVTKDLTFTNDGNAAVTLDLALTGDDTAAFTLGATTVTVPAGGTAQVPVTGDPQRVDPGRFDGYVVGTDATTGAPVTRSSLGLLKEDERYDLTVKLLDRDGNPAAGWVGIGIAGDAWPWSQYVDGQATLRLPPATYILSTQLDVRGEAPDASGVAVLVNPETTLRANTEVVLDARDARLLQTEVAQRTDDRQRKVDFSIVDDSGVEYRSAYEIPASYDDIYVLPTKPMTKGSFMLTTRWRKGEPALSLESPDRRLSFDTQLQAGSSFAKVARTARAVYAGSGAPDDYDRLGAKGKIVVVERSDEVTPDERAQAAADAGAAALIVVNDRPGRLNEYVGESPIPVGTVHRDQGRQLVALARSGRRPLTITETPYPSYVYDLTRDYPGHVPDRSLVYRPRLSELARVDARYYGTHDGEASGFRYDMTLSPALGFHEREWHPGTRVEWVTPDQVWAESHAQSLGTDLPWEMVADETTFTRGTTTRLDWFRPAVRPAFANAFAVTNSRWQDYMTWNVQDWSSSSDHQRLGGNLPWGSTPTHLRIYQGDTLIHDNQLGSDMQWVEVPPGDRSYRAVLDDERPADVFRLSTRTHTEWAFRSDTVDADDFVPFAVMQLDYDLATDLRGDLEPAAEHSIGVRPTSSNGADVPGRITQVTLSLSYDDGATWQPLALTRGADGWWRGSFKPRRSSGFISVRASATRDSGYGITQEITRAYGIR